MDDIAFNDWPGQPVDLSSSNPWLPAYGYQQPSALLDKDDFIGNPDAALFLQGSPGSNYVFLETIVEETSDDLRSESDRSGSRASPVGWLATDSESGSVIRVDVEGIDDIDSYSESEIACPAKRRRQDPNLLNMPCVYSDSDSISNHSLSRSSSLLQFETLEKHCQDGYSSSPSILSLYSQDSLEHQRRTHDLSPDSLDREQNGQSDTESDSDYYTARLTSVPAVVNRTYRLNSDSDSKSDSEGSQSQNSDETLQVASRSNSYKSVQNLSSLKSCRSFDSLHIVKNINKKDNKMSAENLSEDSGYSDHLCNYMKNKSSSIPNMQVQGIVVPEKSTVKQVNDLSLKKISNMRKSGNVSSDELNRNGFRIKRNNSRSDGFDAYDGEGVFQSCASHFGSSYQDLTVFERYESMGIRGSNVIIGKRSVHSEHQASTDACGTLNIESSTECVVVKYNTVGSAQSEPNLLQHSENSRVSATEVFGFENPQECYYNLENSFSYITSVSSVPNGLNLSGDGVEESWRNLLLTNHSGSSIAAQNLDLTQLNPVTEKNDHVMIKQEENNEEFKMAAHVYRQEGSNVSAVLRQQRETSSISSSGGSDISMPRYRREGSYVKAISEYLDISEITDDEREQSYTDPADNSKRILDIESRIEKAISETSIQSFNDDTTKIKMLFHSTPINKRINNVSTPNLSSLPSTLLIDKSSEIHRSMQNVPRKSSLIDRSVSTTGVSDDHDDPEDRTITSKTFSGSGSTTKGVHFCPIVSEVSWRDSSCSASSDMSSYSISSTPHEQSQSPEPNYPPIKPPRKSSSQPELPQCGANGSQKEKETEYIFIPLNPQKWASSTPSMSQSSSNDAGKRKMVITVTSTKRHHKNNGGSNKKEDGPVSKTSEVKEVEQQQFSDRKVAPTLPPVVVGLSAQPQLHSESQSLLDHERFRVVVDSSERPAMDSTVTAGRPHSAPSKPTRAAKFGGFLSRFASFRFSNRKSEDKNKKKSTSLKNVPPVTESKQNELKVNNKSQKEDYIYIPLKGPLPAELLARERGLAGRVYNNGEEKKEVIEKSEVIVRVCENNENNNLCVSGKPPLPRAPPRVVGACAKRSTVPQPPQQRAGQAPPPPTPRRGNIDHRETVTIGVGTRPRHAISMEPMGLIETDLDTEVTVITAGAGAHAHAKTRSLMNLGGGEPPPHRRALLVGTDAPDRPHKSMEFLLDKQNLKAVEPPENELQKCTTERVMSEHQLRVQRSLQKLTVPEWYKANQVPREGFILKKQRNEPRWLGTGNASTTNNSKTPSLTSLGSAHSPILLSPQPHQQQPFTRWSTSKLNSAASSPCASTRSSFNHRTSNGGISPCSVRSSFSYRQPYLGWRSQERLTRPRTPAERLATSLLPPINHTDTQEIQSSIKEVTSAIVHYVSGLKPDHTDRSSVSPTSSPRLDTPRGYRSCYDQDNASNRSASPQSRGSQKLCWLESSFVGTRPLDSPQTPVSLTGQDSTSSSNQHTVTTVVTPTSGVAPPTSLRLDLQKNINNEMMAHMMDLNPTRPSPSSTTLEDVLDSLLGLPPSTRAPSPCLQGTASASTSPSKLNRGGESYRRRSEGSEPSARTTPGSATQTRRVSFHASPSSDNHTNVNVKCRYSRCGKVSAQNSDAGKKYKNCHNCTYIYCSRECRRAHWEKHRMTCLFSRVGALCRQVLAAAKEHKETLKSLSLLARQGYLAQGNGAVKCFFSSPECAEKFIAGNVKALGEPVYIPWADLLPSEMGPNLYSDLIKMCKIYNPDTKFVLYVSVCVVSEVPATGAVKWERQLVSRCAKIRLCKSVVSQINPEGIDKTTVILASINNETLSVQEKREISFTHIQRQLRQRGVSLKKEFPEVYRKLWAYVEGKTDKFAPVTVYPKDATSGKSFMIIIMPDVTEPNKLKLKLPNTDSPRSHLNSVTD